MLPYDWSSLTYVQKATAILDVYRPGMRTRDIADALNPNLSNDQILKVYRKIDWLKTEAPRPPRGKESQVPLPILKTFMSQGIDTPAMTEWTSEVR